MIGNVARNISARASRLSFLPRNETIATRVSTLRRRHERGGTRVDKLKPVGIEERIDDGARKTFRRSTPSCAFTRERKLMRDLVARVSSTATITMRNTAFQTVQNGG